MRLEPIPDERLQSYARVLLEISEVYGVKDVPEIYQCIEMLLDAIRKYRASVEAGVYDLTAEENAERKRLVSRFLVRFKESYGVDYPGKISSGDMRMLGVVLERLKELSVTIDDYLDWLFKDFLTENTKLRLTQIKSLASEFYLNTFALHAHESGLVKIRQEEARKTAELSEIASRVRAIKRICGDSRPDIIEKLKTAVSMFQENQLDGQSLITSLNKLETRLTQSIATGAEREAGTVREQPAMEVAQGGLPANEGAEQQSPSEDSKTATNETPQVVENANVNDTPQPKRRGRPPKNPKN